MNQSEFDAFSKLLSDTAEYYRQPLARAAVRIYWAALYRYELEAIRSLLNDHITHGKFMPTVAELLDTLRTMDGRPDAEEAWSIVAPSLNDEGVTVVRTDEMASAFGVALGLQDDRVAARMAFKESYNKAVRDARRQGKPAVWRMSLGTNAFGRDGPLIKSVSEGKMLPAHVQQFLSGPEPVAEMQRLLALTVKRQPAIERQPGETDE